jgi:hypothetical protein
MALQCNHCGKSYLTNAALYKHKTLAHPKPSLVLLNHVHKDMNEPPNSGVKRPADEDLDKQAKFRKTASDTPLAILPPPISGQVTKFKKPEEKPRDFEIKPKPHSHSKPDSQSSDNPVLPSQTDGGIAIASPKQINQIPVSSDGDYKRKYEECVREREYLNDRYNKEVGKIRKDYESDLNNLKKKVQECEDRIKDMRDKHKRKVTDLEFELEDKYGDKIRQMQEYHEESIDDLKIQHKKELSEYERECYEKIELLNNQIQAIKDDEEDIGDLTKAIFNCTTMEEIFEIQRLIKNYKMDEVVQKHLPTLQNLLLSLSYGVLPLCQPQRSKVTDNQRSIVQRLQSASKNSAKNLLKEKQTDIINLFEIVKDSLKLARSSYNRFGTP